MVRHSRKPGYPRRRRLVSYRPPVRSITPRQPPGRSGSSPSPFVSLTVSLSLSLSALFSPFSFSLLLLNFLTPPSLRIRVTRLLLSLIFSNLHQSRFPRRFSNPFILSSSSSLSISSNVHRATRLARSTFLLLCLCSFTLSYLSHDSSPSDGISLFQRTLLRSSTHLDAARCAFDSFVRQPRPDQEQRRGGGGRNGDGERDRGCSLCRSWQQQTALWLETEGRVHGVHLKFVQPHFVTSRRDYAINCSFKACPPPHRCGHRYARHDCFRLRPRDKQRATGISKHR